MRISDWSSDVCSSDLLTREAPYLVYASCKRNPAPAIVSNTSSIFHSIIAFQLTPTFPRLVRLAMGADIGIRFLAGLSWRLIPATLTMSWPGYCFFNAMVMTATLSSEVQKRMDGVLQHSEERREGKGCVRQ